MSARPVVLLVTDNASLVMTASADEWQLRPTHPDDLVRQLPPYEDVPAATVVDLPDPAALDRIVRSLRSACGARLPVLLLADAHDHPALSRLDDATVTVLDLPVSRDKLLTAIRRLLPAHRDSPQSRQRRSARLPTREVPKVEPLSGQAAAWARGLLAEPTLAGVDDAAERLTSECLEVVDADAAAVLVADGPSWRVAAGEGLRPLEYRYALDSSHWLVEEIGFPGRGALVEDTDVARAQLSGAPLAERRNLLVAAVPGGTALVMLARDGDPSFTVSELRRIAAITSQSAPGIDDALSMRALARRLEPLADRPT